MRAGGWTGAAASALALAILPGALQLMPEARVPDRAAPLAWGMTEATVAATEEVAPPPDDVPITPPGDDLTGELAPILPARTPFRAARSTRTGGGERAAGTGEIFALVVGINDYPGSKHDLGSAVADADTVDAALAGFGVPASNRVVLRDGQARRAQLVAAIRALAAASGTDSTVVFAYAGHARKLDDGTEAIVAADGGLLRDHELAALLSPLTTQPVWLLMASCFGGGFTEALGPGRVLTAAADANSLAYESPSLNGSYLVHYLAREGWLEGRAGPSVQEAFAYARARIDELYPNRRPMQIDQAGRPIKLGSQPGTGTSQSGSPSQQPSPSPAGPPPTTEPPERKCTLLLLCRSG